MKKLNLIFLFILFLLVLPMISALGDDWIIKGDSVYINDSRVWINITPYNRVGNGDILIDFESKVYDGAITVVFGFNSSDLQGEIKPTNFQRYNPHQVQKSYTCEYQFSYDLNYVLDDNTTEKHAWCWDIIDGKNETYFSHSFETGNIQTKTMYWSETEDWSDVNANFGKVNHALLGKDTWYYASGLSINQGQRYLAKIEMDIPASANPTSVKYDYAFFPSIYGSNVKQAYLDGNLYLLDPLTTYSSFYFQSTGTSYTLGDCGDTDLSHSMGLEYNGGYLWYLNIEDKDICRYTISGGSTTTYSLDADTTTPKSFTCTESYCYVADAQGTYVEIDRYTTGWSFDTEDLYVIDDIRDSDGGFVMTNDGTYFYAAYNDASNSNIFKVSKLAISDGRSPVSPSSISSYNYMGGIVYNGANLIINSIAYSDPNYIDRIYQSPTTLGSVTASDVLTTSTALANMWEAIAYDGTYYYLQDKSPKTRVVRYVLNSPPVFTWLNISNTKPIYSTDTLNGQFTVDDVNEDTVSITVSWQNSTDNVTWSDWDTDDETFSSQTFATYDGKLYNTSATGDIEPADLEGGQYWRIEATVTSTYGTTTDYSPSILIIGDGINITGYEVYNNDVEENAELEQDVYVSVNVSHVSDNTLISWVNATINSSTITLLDNVNLTKSGDSAVWNTSTINFDSTGVYEVFIQAKGIETYDNISFNITITEELTIDSYDILRGLSEVTSAGIGNVISFNSSLTHSIDNSQISWVNYTVNSTNNILLNNVNGTADVTNSKWTSNSIEFNETGIYEVEIYTKGTEDYNRTTFNLTVTDVVTLNIETALLDINVFGTNSTNFTLLTDTSSNFDFVPYHTFNTTIFDVDFSEATLTANNATYDFFTVTIQQIKYAGDNTYAGIIGVNRTNSSYSDETNVSLSMVVLDRNAPKYLSINPSGVLVDVETNHYIYFYDEQNITDVTISLQDPDSILIFDDKSIIYDSATQNLNGSYNITYYQNITAEKLGTYNIVNLTATDVGGNILTEVTVSSFTGTSNVAVVDYDWIRNGIVSTPKFGNTIYLSSTIIHAIDGANLNFVNFSINSTDNVLLTNQNGTRSSDSSVWNSSLIEFNETGVYEVVFIASDGTSTDEERFNVTIIDVVSFTVDDEDNPINALDSDTSSFTIDHDSTSEFEFDFYHTFNTSIFNISFNESSKNVSAASEIILFTAEQILWVEDYNYSGVVGINRTNSTYNQEYNLTINLNVTDGNAPAYLSGAPSTATVGTQFTFTINFRDEQNITSAKISLEDSDSLVVLDDISMVYDSTSGNINGTNNIIYTKTYTPLKSGTYSVLNISAIDENGNTLLALPLLNVVASNASTPVAGGGGGGGGTTVVVTEEEKNATITINPIVDEFVKSRGSATTREFTITNEESEDIVVSLAIVDSADNSDDWILFQNGYKEFTINIEKSEGLVQATKFIRYIIAVPDEAELGVYNYNISIIVDGQQYYYQAKVEVVESFWQDFIELLNTDIYSDELEYCVDDSFSSTDECENLETRGINIQLKHVLIFLIIIIFIYLVIFEFNIFKRRKQ